MSRRSILIAMGVMGATSVACSEPYSFRGITLGTSLEDVRRFRFPEAPEARIVCTHDAEARDLRPTEETSLSEQDLANGIMVCGVFAFRKILGKDSRLLPPEWVTARLDIAHIEVSATFWFLPTAGASQGPGAGVPGNSEEQSQLYRIAMRSNATFWPDMLAAFQRRYGKPASVERTAPPAAPGGGLDNLTATWRNEASTIRLVKRSERPQRLSIVYQHTALATEAAR